MRHGCLVQAACLFLGSCQPRPFVCAPLQWGLPTSSKKKQELWERIQAQVRHQDRCGRSGAGMGGACPCRPTSVGGALPSRSRTRGAA